MIDSAAILGRLRSIRMSAEESREAWRAIAAHRARKPVRAPVDACHAVSTEREDRALRREIDAYVRTHPIGTPLPKYKIARYSLFRFAFFRPALAAFAAVLLSVSGVSLAAASSLPGDALYDFKINVNEPLGGILRLGAKAKASYEASLAVHRLEEAEQLTSADKLNTERRVALSRNFSLHAANAKKRIAALDTTGDSQNSESVSSTFEVDLQAHDTLLRLLPDTDDATRRELQSVKEQIRVTIEETREMRRQSETRLKTGTNVRASAEETIKTAGLTMQAAAAKPLRRTAAEKNGTP